MAESRLSWPTDRGNSFLLPGFEGKRRTPLLAIRTFCLACMGGSAQLVAECPSTTCRLYAYRAGAIEPGADRRLLRVIKTYCAGQCLAGEDPVGCTAGKGYLDLGPCSLWPYRRGRNPHYGDERREKLRRHAQEQYQLAGREARFRPRIDGSDSDHSPGHLATHEGLSEGEIRCGRLGETRRRSPHLRQSEVPGRTFAHPENLNAPTAVQDPVSRSRIDEKAPPHSPVHLPHENSPAEDQEAFHG